MSSLELVRPSLTTGPRMGTPVSEPYQNPHNHLPFSVHKTPSTSLPPDIHTLPPEVLVQIFSFAKIYCIHDRDDGECWFDAFASVCTFWRQLAVKTASLWTHIDVGSHTPLSLTQELFRRTEGSAVHIHLHKSSSNHLNSRHIMELLTANVSRIYTLSILGPFSGTDLFGEVLNLWLNHGNATVTNSLTLNNLDIGHIFSPSKKTGDASVLSCSKNSIEVLRSVKTLKLCRVLFHWDNEVYRGLVDLRLSFLAETSVFLRRLIGILSASPELSVLKLANLDIRESYDDDELAPVTLQRLKVLNLSKMSASLSSLLPLLVLPETPSELSVSLPVFFWGHNVALKFLARSNIPKLCLANIAWSGSPMIPPSLPHLSTLILRRCRIHRTDGSGPQPTAQHSHDRFPRLSRIVLIDCPVTLEGLEDLVAGHRLQSLRLETRLLSEPSQAEMEDMVAALQKVYPALQTEVLSKQPKLRLP